jgi:ABC-type multidrug transport system ATPase subunit
MLEIRDLSIYSAHTDTLLLDHISLQWPISHFGAILGPSGCGKTTLLKAIAGIIPHEEGDIFWNGHNVNENDIPPHDLGYVPQFSIVRESLSVEENTQLAIQLRCCGLSKAERQSRLDRVLCETGLIEIRDRLVKVLSGGQKRRLGLALELICNPRLILCDEVTSGLDPRSEDDIVKLLYYLAHQDKRLILSVTHSLAHLELYSSVTLLHTGYLVYHGSAANLFNYLSIEKADQIYSRLNDATPQEWAKFWEDFRIHNAMKAVRELTLIPKIYPPSIDSEGENNTIKNEGEHSTNAAGNDFTPKVPGVLSQTFTLTTLRFKLFFRQASTLLLHILIGLSFPALVVLFALEGLPQIQNMSLEISGNLLTEIKEKLSFVLQSSKVGSLISGIVMFQVILLALIASNNAAREVAAERHLYEKEKLSGLRPTAYWISKLIYFFLLTAVQSLWMTLFVKFICGFPGDLIQQTAILWALNFAMTSTCLAISTWVRSPEQASLVALYVVGFQLPLSGAVLSLPSWLEPIIQPFIASYWAWSGYLQTLQATQYYDLVAAITHTELSPYTLCCYVLIIHAVVFLLVSHMGLQRSCWE